MTTPNAADVRSTDSPADPNLDQRELFGNAVGATIVTTLYARSHAHDHPGIPVDWRDEQATAVWQRLCERGQELGFDPLELTLRDDMHVGGTVLRSRAIDDRVSVFTAHCPGAAVVTLGLGLCNRASRLRHLQASWCGIDIADVVALRRALITDDAVRLLTGSIADDAWLTSIDPHRPTAFVAEGLLMYLPEPQVRALFDRIRHHMRAETVFIADSMPSPLHRAPHPVKKLAGVEYHFGTPRRGGLAAVADGWEPISTIDCMAPMSRSAARLDGLWMLLTGTPMHSVTTLLKSSPR